MMEFEETQLINLFDPKGHIPIEPLPNGATLVYIPHNGKTTITCEGAYHEVGHLSNANMFNGQFVVAYGYDFNTGEWSHGHYARGTGYKNYDDTPVIKETAIQEICDYLKEANYD